MSINHNSQKEVRNRMLKKAAQLWGVPASEIDISFDPIVSILITACAAEIEKISAEVNDSQTRITEKIIQLMTPDTIFGSRPAHAIAYALPLENETVVKPEYLFTHKKKTTYKNTSQNFKNIFFSPFQDFKLVNASVAYMATGNSIYKKNDLEESILYHSGSVELSKSSLYLGIQSDYKNLSLKDVSFYFQSKNVANKRLFYHHLKNAEWYCGATKMKTIEGFYNSKDYNKLKLDTIFNDSSSKTHNIIDQVRNNYLKHYVTLDQNVNLHNSFEELDAIIKENKIDIENQVTWIKIVFPRVIDTTILKDIYCSLNSFPVINRELKSFTYQLKDFINIIPIISEDLFLDIKEISNTEGKNYKLQEKSNKGTEKGTFTLRTNNVGKLDHRKAREYIKHLIELLKDESAAFTYFNNDLLHKNLSKLNQLTALLENKVSEISMKVADTNFINIVPYKKREQLLIDYWTTEGEDANNIKRGSLLKIYNGIGIKQKSSFLVTTSFGGKNDLSMNERLNSYRRSLLSRDRIVTKQDIMALCYEIYGDKIKGVSIKKGYMKHISLTKGLVHCILINLTINQKVNTEVYEWESLNNNLLLYLEKYSVSIFPYKINLTDFNH